MKALRMGLATVALMAVGAAGAEAQRFGVQANYGTDFDFGVGARVEIPVAFTSTGTFSQTFLIGSFDYFFWDCEAGDDIDCSYWEVNANAAVPIAASGINPYVGAGLNIARISFDTDVNIPGFDFGASATEVGLNILGGLRFPLGGMSAYGEGRFELGGGEQLVLTFGILLGS